MNKICLVARNFDTYFIRRLGEELDQNSYVLFNPWLDQKLPEADLFLVRSSGVYQSDLDLQILDRVGERIINALPCLRLHRNKVSQYEHYPQAYVLPWLPSLENPVLAKDFLRLHRSVVCKPHQGQGGWGIRLLNETSFHLWWEEKEASGDRSYLLQKYGGGTELRVFFITHDFRLTLKREKNASATANFATGGRAHVVELPKVLETHVEKLIELSGAFYGALDLIWDGENVFLLELNTVPGIEQLEEVSGVNILKAFLSRL